MPYILRFREENKTKTIRLNDNQAIAVREKLSAKNAKRDEFLTLGLETLRLDQVLSLSAQETDVGKVTKKETREALVRAAKGCFACQGKGFVETHPWKLGESSVMKFCKCQIAVKQARSIDVDDWGFLFNENE